MSVDPIITSRFGVADGYTLEGYERTGGYQALDQAVEQTEEFQAWQREWETIASHWECHYWGSAPTYCRIGAALAQAMRDQLAERSPAAD